HKTVGWRARPTRFYRETSYALTKTKQRADHICFIKSESVRIYVFDYDVRKPVLRGDFIYRIEKPFDAHRANKVVCRLQREIFGNVVPAARPRVGDGFIHHLCPNF